MIATLVDATLHERRVDMSYYSASSKRAKRYEVDPYRVVYYQGGLYLYGRVEEYGEIRTFAVERIQRIALMDETFEMPKDQDIEAHTRNAFGIAGGKAQEVVLRFDEAARGQHQGPNLARIPEDHAAARWLLRSLAQRGPLPRTQGLDPELRAPGAW